MALMVPFSYIVKHVISKSCVTLASLSHCAHIKDIILIVYLRHLNKLGCRNPSLGLATKARAYKVAGKKEAREWRKMSGNEPSHFQGSFHFESLESQWTLKFSKSDCKGQNQMNWRFFYIIGKLLKRKCLKWACMTHLDT